MTIEKDGGESRARRRVRQQGLVASISGKKSVVVQVERRVQHPRYQKIVGRREKFMAHDEENACGVGDLVEIVQSRPLSARKRWRVSRIVRKAITVTTGREG